MKRPVAAKAGARAPVPATPERELPAPILEALRRLDELVRGQLYGLPKRAKETLYVYLKNADLRGLEADGRRRVFDTSSEVVEEATGYKRSSITGANRDLVAWGLIERPPQDLEGARKPGTPVGKTYLTPEADALFFPRLPRAQKPAQPVDGEPKFLRSQGAAPQASEDEAPEAQQPEQPKPAEQPTAAEAPSAAPEELPSKVHVRDDLRPVASIIGAEQLPNVLATCKRFGVWLQDVLAQKLEAIRGARNPLGYLLSLVACGKDWKLPTGEEATAAREAKAEAKATERAAEQDATGAFLADNAGRWLAKPDRSVLVEVLSTCVMEHVPHGRTWRAAALPLETLARVIAAATAGRLQFIDPAEALALRGV